MGKTIQPEVTDPAIEQALMNFNNIKDGGDADGFDLSFEDDDIQAETRKKPSDTVKSPRMRGAGKRATVSATADKRHNISLSSSQWRDVSLMLSCLNLTGAPKSGIAAFLVEMACLGMRKAYPEAFRLFSQYAKGGDD